MKFASRPTHARAARFPVVIAVLLLAGIAVAVPFHHPTIDGYIPGGNPDIPDEEEIFWDPADLVVDDSHDDDDFPTQTAKIKHIWCTWDQDSLYVGTTFQDYGQFQFMTLYLDLDRGIGPRDGTLLAHNPGDYQMPDGHRFELVLGRGSLDTPADPPPIPYLVTSDDGAMSLLDSRVNAKQIVGFPTTGPGQDKARPPYWSFAEMALPWAAIYPGQGGRVPANAVIKMVGVVGNAHPDSNGWDSAPDNIGGSETVLFENLSPSVIDADGDGVPDVSDATISGTVTLPQDPGIRSVTIVAELIDFAGRDPGAPLSAVTTAESIRTWTLPRLPAGRYRITTSAVGYFDDVTTVDVTASQVITGQDRTLEKATSIGGTISFAPDDHDQPGVIRLKTATGTLLQTLDKDLVGGPYTFYVEEGGNYLVEVLAETYFESESLVTVVAGDDRTDVDFLLQRQIEVSGTVSFLEGAGQAGTIFFLDSEGNELDSSGFASTGQDFSFFTPVDGNFTLHANTNSVGTIGFYAPVDIPVNVTGGQDVTGIAVELLLAAYVTSTISFEGPDSDTIWRFLDRNSGYVVVTDTVYAAGDIMASYLGPGEYRLEMKAAGYLPQDLEFNISLEDTSLGVQSLTAVRADHLEIVDEDGIELPEALATKYDPENEELTTHIVRMAARDEAGRDDLFDLDNNLQGFNLSVRKMDDLSAPTGNPVFYSDTTIVNSVVNFSDGRAEFWMSNTQVEVLRVYLAQPDKDPIAGRIVVAFLNPAPSIVLLENLSGESTLIANNEDKITIRATLYDSAGKISKVDNVPITFSVVNGSSGVGQFIQPTKEMFSGVASSDIKATGAGELRITAIVVIDGTPLDVVAYELEGDETELTLEALPGSTAGLNLSLPSNMGDLVTPITVNVQTIDQFGNATADPGRDIVFYAVPTSLGSFSPGSAPTNDSGRASSSYIPTGSAGLVDIDVSSAGLIGDQASLRLRDLVVIPDPVWYDEPDDRQTLEQTDLTALVVANDPDELLLEIPFQSTFSNMQIHVAMEHKFDAAGAVADPFQQPVNYGHALLPDMVLTTKYTNNDYGDLRRFSPSATSKWEVWNFDDNQWIEFTDPDPDGLNGDIDIQERWVTKNGDGLSIAIPKEVFGATFPDSILFEAYLTQDYNDSVKRSAFDSAPQDSTLHLTFDPDDATDEDWEAALGPVTLVEWGRTYIPKTDFPTPPEVVNTRVTPEELEAGETIILETLVTEAPGFGIGDVVANLSAMGGSPETRMYDDGDPGHGDSVAGDGVYSLLAVVPITNPGGTQELIVSAFDSQNIAANRGTTSITVGALVTPIIQAFDEVGDDHGPNQPGTKNKYYTYPTNIAFVEGGFDLTGLTVFETKANIGGELIDMIAFQVSMVDFPDPNDPGTADWNPSYADLNITKIDILIDSAPGGATSSLPWRQASFQPWDAWDYAIIMDGWYKAVIPSLGQNTVDSWRENALSNDKDILLISDPDLDIVTALVSKTALNDPSAEDIAKWDIAVCMASHDFGGEEVLGGVRWVEANRSEWQFGGGQSQEGGSGGDRDSNYMDLLLIPGLGHTAIATQDSLLDYESQDALDRLKDGLMPVALEMSTFEDTGPPVIDTGGKGSVVTVVEPIVDTPLALAINITDDNRVEQATFRYRSTGFEGEGWDREVPMGFLGQDTWIVDILPSWLDSNLVYSPIDSTRYLEFEVEASDPGNDRATPPEAPKTSISPVTTLQIEKNTFCRPRDTTLDLEEIILLQVEGSLLNVTEKLRRNLVNNHISQAWPGKPADPDTMAGAVELQWDVCNIEVAVQQAPRIPEGDPIGVFRQVFLATTDTLGGYLDYEEKIPGNAQLSLHYPQEWIPEGLDENLIALYHYNPESDRWILVGGNVTPTGNNVTATINQVGTYGLFVTEANDYNSGEVISGITISPNPFSPNGDDLYDETAISFYLSQEATITVEVYNIYGDRKNVLAQTFPFSGSSLTDPVPRRVPGLIWDGSDFSGNTVPYGIYILRILATYNFGGGTRTIRSNHPVAVIK